MPDTCRLGNPSAYKKLPIASRDLRYICVMHDIMHGIDTKKALILLHAQDVSQHIQMLSNLSL